MATKISWCDETINPIIGCSKASPGCVNCYAEGMARRLASMKKVAGYSEVVTDGKWNGKTAFVASALDKPYHWHKPRSIFVGSMGDLFHSSVDPLWLNAVMKMVALCGHHTFIFLTKRADLMHDYMRSVIGQPLHNLVLGVSVEDQKEADERIPLLLATPAAKRFISLEPMIGPVDLNNLNGPGHCRYQCLQPVAGDRPGLDGVILGGESGTTARVLRPEWVRTIRDQCARAGVPFMFKQASGIDSNHWIPVVAGYPLQQGFPVLDGRIHNALPWSVR